MNVSRKIFLSTILLSTTACSTLNESLQLGAATGFATGGIASYAANSTTRSKANLQQVVTGAGIGLGVGLLMSYLMHRSVQEDRQQNAIDQTELHFGDLPPSPFLIPKAPSKKRGTQ